MKGSVIRTAVMVLSRISAFVLAPTVLLWVWLVGLHWTAIGVAVAYVLTLLVSVGYEFGRRGFDV